MLHKPSEDGDDREDGPPPVPSKRRYPLLDCAQCGEVFRPVFYRACAHCQHVFEDGKNPPRVVIHGTRLSSVAASYKRYLENFLRERFRLIGTPIRFEFRTGANPFEGKKNALSERQLKKKRRVIRHRKKSG